MVIRGDVTAAEDVTIEGQVHGTIDMKDHVLTIATAATVTAPIVARSVVIKGTVTGSIVACERVDLHSTASVHGNISTPCITLVEGAYFCGAVMTPASRA